MFCQCTWRGGGMPRFMIFIHSVRIESSWNHFQSRTWHLVVRGSYSDARKGRGSWETGRLKRFRGAVGDNTSFIHWHTGQWVHSWQAPKQMLAHTGGHRYRDRYTGYTDRAQATRQIYIGRKQRWKRRPQASYLKAIFMLNHTKVGAGAGAMAQHLRAPAALLENLVLVPSTHPHGSSQLSSSGDLTPSSGSQGH